ncbi:MAG: 2-amino-4-hydroxy-6-hydroxymethyldihydropteridine diphosphokinase [Rhodospirillales bacterium]|nr:2-amino-4-hydroxy-6-hydroxymethyldihydropteridine diphosphokinase [Rhodospirillales bacterium]
MTASPSPILIGIGANLPCAQLGSPRATCEAALVALRQTGLVILRQSNWFKSAPVPASSQPWYINGVIAVETSLNPAQLMSLMGAIEDRFGRTRRQKNAARTLDLDLIAYGDTVIGWNPEEPNGLTLPHRRMNERGFVLLPLLEIAPDWLHPVLYLSMDKMIAALDPNQQTMRDE